jgi:alkanesulfonate monooxygenase SsuD/methylene tetrahydromethanopterin reductase-like flavin-dependent oxidoreductase (luciferase family)
MSERRIGVALSGSNAAALMEQIERAEQAGIQAVWMTTGGARLDSITTFAAAAGRTNQIIFGTSITAVEGHYRILHVCLPRV